MRPITGILFTVFLLSPLSRGWMQESTFRSPEETSIRIHATMTNEVTELDLSVIKKNQNRIRVATLEKRGASGRIIQVFSNDQIVEVWENVSGNEKRSLSRLDAATSLFDLISLTPDYHFRSPKGFDLNSQVFKGYRVELQYSKSMKNTVADDQPKKLLLYQVSESDQQLIRSIHYVSFFEKVEPYLQPKELTFSDETTGETGRIIIQSLEYNVGLPDFLFRLPKAD